MDQNRPFKEIILDCHDVISLVKAIAVAMGEKITGLRDGLALDEASLMKILGLTGAIWIHSGDPKKPHALLHSGKHSDGFINVLSALKFTPICDLLGFLLAEEIVKIYRGPVGWIIGSCHAGVPIAYSVGSFLGVKTDFPDKGPDGNQQLWTRHVIGSDEIIVQVEDLVTTFKTLEAVRQGIIAAHQYPINFAPVIATVVNRSGESMFHNAPIISLLSPTIKTWEKDECPLCQGGSVAVRPKENWALLTE